MVSWNSKVFRYGHEDDPYTYSVVNSLYVLVKAARDLAKQGHLIESFDYPQPGPYGRSLGFTDNTTKERRVMYLVHVKERAGFHQPEGSWEALGLTNKEIHSLIQTPGGRETLFGGAKKGIEHVVRNTKILLRGSKRWSDEQIVSALRAAVSDWNHFPPRSQLTLETFLEKRPVMFTCLYWGALIRLAEGLEGLERVWVSAHERWVEVAAIKLQTTKFVRGLKNPRFGYGPRKSDCK